MGAQHQSEINCKYLYSWHTAGGTVKLQWCGLSHHPHSDPEETWLVYHWLMVSEHMQQYGLQHKKSAGHSDAAQDRKQHATYCITQLAPQHNTRTSCHPGYHHHI